MAKKKEKAEKAERYPLGIESALAALNKQYGKKPQFGEPVRRIIPLQYVELGILLGGLAHPGLPTGVFIEVLGPAGAGKTTLAQLICDAVINQPDAEHRIVVETGVKIRKPPRRALVVDYEHVIDMGYFRNAVRNADLAVTNQLGKITNVKNANVWVCQPDTLEEGGDVMLQMIGSGEFGVIVLDSVAAMLPEEEREKSMGEATMGVHARAMGKFLRKSAHMVRRYGVVVVIINQYRKNIGGYGPARKGTGGEALEYYDAIRLDISGKHETPYFDAGSKIAEIKCYKNKVTGIRNVGCEYHIQHGRGLSFEVEITLMAMAAGVLKWSGRRKSPVEVGGKKYADGIEWFRVLRAEPAKYARLKAECAKRGVLRLPQGTGFGD